MRIMYSWLHWHQFRIEGAAIVNDISGFLLTVGGGGGGGGGGAEEEEEQVRPKLWN
jgi:hypothetical protein